MKAMLYRLVSRVLVVVYLFQFLAGSYAWAIIEVPELNSFKLQHQRRYEIARDNELGIVLKNGQDILKSCNHGSVSYNFGGISIVFDSLGNASVHNLTNTVVDSFSLSLPGSIWFGENLDLKDAAIKADKIFLNHRLNAKRLELMGHTTVASGVEINLKRLLVEGASFNNGGDVKVSDDALIASRDMINQHNITAKRYFQTAKSGHNLGAINGEDNATIDNKNSTWINKKTLTSAKDIGITGDFGNQGFFASAGVMETRGKIHNSGTIEVKGNASLGGIENQDGSINLGGATCINGDINNQALLTFNNSQIKGNINNTGNLGFGGSTNFTGNNSIGNLGDIVFAGSSQGRLATLTNKGTLTQEGEASLNITKILNHNTWICKNPNLEIGTMGNAGVVNFSSGIIKTNRLVNYGLVEGFGEWDARFIDLENHGRMSLNGGKISGDKFRNTGNFVTSATGMLYSHHLINQGTFHALKGVSAGAYYNTGLFIYGAGNLAESLALPLTNAKAKAPTGVVPHLSFTNHGEVRGNIAVRETKCLKPDHLSAPKQNSTAQFLNHGNINADAFKWNVKGSKFTNAQNLNSASKVEVTADKVYLKGAIQANSNVTIKANAYADTPKASIKTGGEIEIDTSSSYGTQRNLYAQLMARRLILRAYNFALNKNMDIPCEARIYAKKFTNPDYHLKVMGNAYLYFDDVINGIADDQDHTVANVKALLEAHGDINLYFKGQIDNRFGRIFSGGKLKANSDRLTSTIECGNLRQAAPLYLNSPNGSFFYGVKGVEVQAGKINMEFGRIRSGAYMHLKALSDISLTSSIFDARGDFLIEAINLKLTRQGFKSLFYKNGKEVFTGNANISEPSWLYSTKRVLLKIRDKIHLVGSNIVGFEGVTNYNSPLNLRTSENAPYYSGQQNTTAFILESFKHQDTASGTHKNPNYDQNKPTLANIGGNSIVVGGGGCFNIIGGGCFNINGRNITNGSLNVDPNGDVHGTNVPLVNGEVYNHNRLNAKNVTFIAKPHSTISSAIDIGFNAYNYLWSGAITAPNIMLSGTNFTFGGEVPRISQGIITHPLQILMCLDEGAYLKKASKYSSKDVAYCWGLSKSENHNIILPEVSILGTSQTLTQVGDIKKLRFLVSAPVLAAYLARLNTIHFNQCFTGSAETELGQLYECMENAKKVLGNRKIVDPKELDNLDKPCLFFVPYKLDDGEVVLAPVYRATANGVRLLKESSTSNLRGDNITMGFENDMKIYREFFASKNMRLASGNVTIGEGGKLTGGEIGVEAKQTVHLIGGEVIGKYKVTLKGEDVIIEALFKEDNITTHVPSLVKSLEDSVVIEALRNINVIASNLNAGLDINLISGNTISVEDKVLGTEFYKSYMTSGRDVNSTGVNTSIRGSDVKSGGTIRDRSVNFSVLTSKTTTTEDHGDFTISKDVLSRSNLNAGYLDLNEKNSVLLEGAIINLANGFRIQAPNIAFKNAYQRTIKLIRENHKAQIPVTEIPTNLQALEKHKNFEFKQTSTPLEVNSSGPGHIDGGNVEGTGIKLKTKTKLSWKVGDIDLHSAQNIESSKRGNKTTLKVTHDSTELKVENGGISGEGENSQTFTGVKFEVDDQIHLKTENGPTSLLCDKNIDRSSESSTRKNLLFTTTRNRGHSHETVNMCEALSKGGMIVESKKGVYVEVKSGDLGNDLRTKWVLELRQNPTVMWEKITEKHQEWNRTQRTLTPAAAGVLGLGISLVTSGWGASLLSLGGVAGKIASTALTNIMSRASISLINNQGDLGKVFKELSSSKSLRSFAVMLASAGITGIVGLPTEAQGFEQHLKSNLINTGVSTSLSVIIEGKDPKEALGEALRTITAHTLGGMIANNIGKNYHDGKINGFEQKVSHLLLGGGMGAILSKNPFKGILPGALGSVAAECLAEMLSPDNVDSVISRVSAKGKNLSDRNLTQLYKQELRAYREEIKTSAKWAKFGAGVIALSTGQNVDIAIETAKNSVENNFVLPLIAGVIAEISIESLIVLGGRLILASKVFNTVETQRQLREDEVNEKEDREKNIGGEEPNQPENENTNLPKQLRSYVKDIEEKSNLKMPENQRNLLSNQLREKKFTKLGKEEKKIHTDNYTPKKKNQLMSDWEQNTGKKWPESMQFNPKKQIDEMTPHQAHHIIPQQFKGPHEWWNIHPIAQPKHQSGVHGKGSILNEIVKDLKK